jgi:hypothetical protein
VLARIINQLHFVIRGISNKTQHNRNLVLGHTHRKQTEVGFHPWKRNFLRVVKSDHRTTWVLDTHNGERYPNLFFSPFGVKFSSSMSVTKFMLLGAPVLATCQGKWH